MLTPDLEFNRSLTRDLTLYRYPLLDEEGEGVDLTWYAEVSVHLPRRGDTYPVYEVPAGKVVLLDEFVFWCHAAPHAICGGSIGRVTLDGGYQITINAAAAGGEANHYVPARPIVYFPGEWIAVCPHHLGELSDVPFRLTARFREKPAPPGAVAGRQERLVGGAQP
ncbi:MAG TPA: hypothetical protein VM221_08720 [Armatimonadota bacterium]|nr:hypothetical protein [Armatimonadota bacterium]